MLPVQITTREIPLSDSLETLIRKKSEKLERYFSQIISCRIVIDLPQKHKHQGKLYNIRIEVGVPGKELVSTYKQHEDIYVAIRDSFEAVERQLEDYAHKRHGRIKTHEPERRGVINRIIANEGYGFIDGDDGVEYYFSITNVRHPQFEMLVTGDRVQFTIQPLGQGWQATHITRG